MNNSKKKNSGFQIHHNAPPSGIVRFFISKTIMWLVGWKVTGKLPKDKKFILLGEPHTSNWDFLLMFGAAYSLRLNVSWLGKDAIFKIPFGTIMRYFGGIPINRKRTNDLVQSTTKLFQESERLAMVIGPSGTRSKRDYWKSGFYWIAHTSNIPVVCSYLDFANKIVHVGLCLRLKGDVKKDMDEIRKFYKGIRGKHPELESDIRFKDE